MGDVTERLLTPSKISAWLECPHYLALRHQVDEGTLEAELGGFGSFAQLLADKGTAHEAACLDHYRAEGLSVCEVPPRDEHERFAAWAERTAHLLDEGHDVLYQLPLVHDGVRGIADFLVRVERDGRNSYEPVDAKLARAEAKPGHVLQLCFYAEAIEAATGVAPRGVHLWLGSGRIETIAAHTVLPYWRRLRAQVRAAIDDPAPEHPPEPCGHCTFCELAGHCTSGWRDADSLVFVAGIRAPERAALVAEGCATLDALGRLTSPVTGIRPDRSSILTDQAALQAQARTSPDGPVPFRLVSPGDDPTWGRGLELLPAPDEGDVFLDFEGHPFWTAEAGLFFLLGLIEREGGEWRFRAFWAHDPDEEAAATEALLDHLAARRERYPDMHVYHYNHTERSSLNRLTATHGVAEAQLATLVDTGLFVDLLGIVRNAVQIGAESYGLKAVEELTDFVRSHEIEQGAGAVLAYEACMADGDPVHLDQIARYNEDDVRATLAVRDWLVDHRDPGLPWRAARLEPDEGIPELDEQVAALHAFDPGTTEHDLGDVLGYWRREWLAFLAPKLVRAQAEVDIALEDPEVIAGLESLGLRDRVNKKGGPLKGHAMRFRFPEQDTSALGNDLGQVIYGTVDGPTGFANVDSFDRATGTLDLNWSERCQELGVVPTAVVLNDWVSPNPKPDALTELAADVLAGDAANPASLALLRRDAPAFVAGGGPPRGRFGDDVDEMRRWARDLDGTCVAVQGPPGTGKTYRGAHMVHELVTQGRRVGITAMSHHAIGNFLNQIIEVFDEKGDRGLLRAVRKVTNTKAASPSEVKLTSSNKACAKDDVNLVAGTPWLFANQLMADAPVDVLIVDEAGQLALADALAAGRAARNIVLLGDPAQLPQVAQASHPGVGGHSALGHVLGDDPTMPSDRGVFISETRRMHPDVCRFISDEIYDGRLTSHPSCAVQGTELGTGLRWLRAEHEACTTSSPEEAEVVWAEARRLIGASWTDHHGVTRPMEPTDLMVVAPFNDQVALLRARLDSDPATAGVPVGTVDKFQGRQAAVVFFTMTTSSGADLTRGADFLFSRQRLNVAVSRARCLAYLVCTDALLNSRARTLDELQLISTLCAFVESTDGVPERAGGG
ncbi:TM0106 family RecB-like putative nuclease [Iamia sp. SCSIO 61187]|uniref:TM0106 family RecB-like putative nuclease n=1 Tax=Iamia sp. SCSIO 61187 TaxID=2722752 RepID=UPI001C6275E6|nr:TM0106 family RecB-like putative nuclease [Iamia sp. SCSIO 61187]QYG95217.1 TM0106 family RecB-like putative nuclease [Iamia sp. SCSIO 61187]